MKYTEKIQKAIKFSAKTHQVYQNQKRKGKEIPYITHPLTVGLILCLAGAKEDVIVAGILHDTIEDSPQNKKVTKAMLSERFGSAVAGLVCDVTEANKKSPWEKRKQEALKKIETYSHDALLLKSADLLSNVSELIDDHARFGDEIFSRFAMPKEKTLEHYETAIKLILQHWKNNPLAGDLQKVRGGLKKIIANGV